MFEHTNQIMSVSTAGRLCELDEYLAHLAHLAQSYFLCYVGPLIGLSLKHCFFGNFRQFLVALAHPSIL